MNNLRLISLCIIAMSAVGCGQPDDTTVEQKVNASSADTSQATVKETNNTDMEKTTTEYVEKGKEVIVEKTKEVVETVKTKTIELKEDADDKAAELMKKNNLSN